MSDEQVKDVGVLLKQERERKGISLEVVHDATKVPMDALKAIEEGYKVRTLTAFYYKSFVKIYAHYIGLDANAIVAMIPTHHPKPEAVAAFIRPGAVARPAAPSGAGPHRVEGVRSLNLLSNPIVLKKKKKFFTLAIVIAAVVAGLFAAGFMVHKITTAISVHRALDAASKPAPKPAGKRPKTVPAKAEAALRTQETKTPDDNEGDDRAEKAPRRISLIVRAQVNTWIDVHVDGQSVFRGTFKKGLSSAWHGTKKIELTAKDLGALEFEVNGRNVAKLTRRDPKARKVIVTPEGLNVE